MTSALARHYPETVLAGLAERLSAPGATAEDIANTALGKASHLGEEGADPSALAVLAVLDARRRPIRGASLLREAVLQGLGRRRRGPAKSARSRRRRHPARPWSTPMVAGRGDRKPALPPARGFLSRRRARLAHPQVTTRTPRRRFALDGEDVTPFGPTDDGPLELNLLHLTHMLDGDGLALNKDGAANRRSLLRFVQGLRLPEGDVSEAQDLTIPRVVEPIHHTMALAVSMGLLDVSEGRLTADPARAESFFEADEDERNKALLKAWRADVLWGSVEALDALEGIGPVDGERRQPLDRSLFSSSGGKLAGARGQILGDLAQLPLDDWADLDAVVGILLELDRGYLGEALDPAAIRRALFRPR